MRLWLAAQVPPGLVRLPHPAYPAR